MAWSSLALTPRRTLHCRLLSSSREAALAVRELDRSGVVGPFLPGVHTCRQRRGHPSVLPPLPCPPAWSLGCGFGRARALLLHVQCRVHARTRPISSLCPVSADCNPFPVCGQTVRSCGWRFKQRTVRRPGGDALVLRPWPTPCISTPSPPCVRVQKCVSPLQVWVCPLPGARDGALPFGPVSWTGPLGDGGLSSSNSPPRL